MINRYLNVSIAGLLLELKYCESYKKSLKLLILILKQKKTKKSHRRKDLDALPQHKNIP